MSKCLRIMSLLVFLMSCSGEDAKLIKPANKIQLNPGRISIINFWAEWCKPCIKEIPELNALAEKRQDIDVYAINFDRLEGEALSTAVQRFNISYQIASFQLSESLAIPTPTVLPTTVIVDPQGNIQNNLIGPQTAEALEELIDAL